MAKRLRIIAYIRVSVVGEREQDGESFRSPDLQRAAIDGILATTPGAEVVEEIRDLNKSGGTMDRPGLNRAMAMLADGEADGIAVARLDRFARTTGAIDVIQDMATRGHVFVSAADKFDTSTPVGMMMLGIMLVVAKFERDRHVENIYVLNAGKIADGVHIIVPYGYRRSDGKGSRLEEDPVTAPVVRRIFAAAVAGETASSIARALNVDGIPSKKGGRWNKQAVAALLRARSYLGEAKWGENVFPGAHPELVSDEDFELATSRSSGRPAGDYTGRPVRGQGMFLLSGLVLCAGCGHIMQSSTHTKGSKRWRCTGDHGDGKCPAPTGAFMAPLEDIVCGQFLGRHAAGRVGGAESGADLAAAEAKVAKLRTEYVRWRDDAEMRDEVGEDDYRAGLRARKAALTAAENTVDGLLRVAKAAGLVVEPAAWETMTMLERRELLRASVSSVEVSRASSTRAPLAPRVVVRFHGDADDSPFAALAA